MASQGSDLFGPDPGSDPLAYYRAAGSGADLYGSSPPEVAAKWRSFVSELARQGGGELSRVQTYLDRHVNDLGLAFRFTGDEQERAWPLSPVPMVIGAAEWARVEEGLIQRAELLEMVIHDMYGPQRLVADGHLPPAMIAGSPNFARRMIGAEPRGGFRLHVHAVDLARGPTGEWRALADRVRLPIGIGYALENRLALRRATGGLLASIGTRRQSDFFDALRDGMAACCTRADPRIALLTPGRFNQGYPEQAHLARHLGFSLVEGRDLVVREDQLFVRTIAGLKRIDGLWRWIDTRDIDPLNFNSRSRIGVPNLVLACTSGNLAMANWPGAGVVESRAMAAFLPRLCNELLGERLKLPNVATWWCGGEHERRYVLENLERLVISSAFRQPVEVLADGRTRHGSSLDDGEREALLRAIDRRPMDYAAQELVDLSTTPCLVGNMLEPRSFTLRAYLARDGEGKWVVLPSGFGRVSPHGDLRTSLMGMGDISCDVCIVDQPSSPRTVPTPTMDSPAVRREQGLLPSQAADNLFWLGRYTERSHQTARVVRTLLDAANALQVGGGSGTPATRLSKLLERWQATPAGAAGWSPIRVAGAALSNGDQTGSLGSLAKTIHLLALLLRDRLNRDSWRTLNRALPTFAIDDIESLGAASELMIERHAALAWLNEDAMSYSVAWRFLDLGIRIERASLIVQACLELVPGQASGEDLAALLDLVDAQSLYRSRYLAMPFIAPVLDMVVLDPSHPRGLAFQASRIVDHLENLPSLQENGLAARPLRASRQFYAAIEAMEADALTPPVLEAWLGEIGRLSGAIGSRYFLQEEQGQGAGEATLLV